MKNWINIILIWLISLPIFAQAPLGFNYQGIARQADGTPISGQDIGIKVSIIDGPQGVIQFTEEHFLTTNNFGLFTAIVGQGSGGNTLNSVDWSIGNLWLQIELDPDNSGNYIMMGSQQLMSVPYSLFAQQSGEGLSPGYGIDINNGTISNILPDRPVSITGVGDVQVSGTYPNFTIESNGSNDGDADPTNEIQTISKAGNEVTLSKAGGSFTDEVDDADADATNEIQDLQLVGNILTVTKNGLATTIDLSPYLDNTDTQLTEIEVDGFVSNNGYLTAELDGDASNELQTISKSGSNVTLSNAGGSFTDAVDDADADASNEIQDLQLVGDELTITNNGTATSIDLSGYLDDTDTHLTEAEVDGFVANDGYLKTEVDGSVSNEIQDLQLVGDNLTITNNGSATTIDLSAYLDNTDEQNLTNVLAVSNSAGSSKITNLADPTLAQDATTKNYVDTQDVALQGSINSEVTNRTNADGTIQSELDASQAGAGLDTDGSYTADASTNYLTAATDLKDADKKLDDQIQSNSSGISTLTGRLDNTYAFQASFTINETGIVTENQVVLIENLDGFNQIDLNEIVIGASGLYMILVDSERINADGNLSRLIIRINSTDYVIYVPVAAQNVTRTLMVNLSIGDSITLLDTTIGAQLVPLTGVIGGYKISN